MKTLTYKDPMSAHTEISYLLLNKLIAHGSVGLNAQVELNYLGDHEDDPQSHMIALRETPNYESVFVSWVEPVDGYDYEIYVEDLAGPRKIATTTELQMVVPMLLAARLVMTK